MIHRSLLDNGIRIISETLPAAHSVTIGVWVENGSRHERAGNNGISHFIEHMLFKGTSRRSARDVAREIDSVGGILNAFTSREFSCYFAKVLARRLPLAVDLLGDVILNPLFDLDEVEKERRVILQEISMVEDTADDLIHDLFNETFWNGHPLGFPISGNMDTVGAFDRDALIRFLQQHYTGQRLFVCAAGDVDHEHLVELVNRAFADLPASGPAADETAPAYRRHIGITPKELEQVHLCLGTRALSQNHPDRFASYLLNAVLGGSMSSRLFQTIREDRGLVYSIYSFLHCHTDAGTLAVYAGCSPQDARQVVDLILKEMRRLRNQPIPEAELTAAREQLRGNLLLSLESSENRMTRLAKNELYVGRNLSIKEVLRSIDEVSVDTLQQLVGQLFRDEYLNLHLLGQVEPEDFPAFDLTLG